MKVLCLLSAAFLIGLPVLAQEAIDPNAPDERKFTVEDTASTDHAKLETNPVDPSPTAQIPAEQTSVKVTAIKTIYVAPMGSVQGSEIIRQKVINGLIKSGVVRVVESADRADATLTGASELDRRHGTFVNISPYGAFVNSRTRYTAECVARLVGKDDQILWSGDLSSRRFFASHSSRGASSNVADKIVKEVTAIIAPPEKQLAAK